MWDERISHSLIQVNVVVLLQIKIFIHLTICFHNRGHASIWVTILLAWADQLWVCHDCIWDHLMKSCAIPILSVFSFLFLHYLLFPFGTETRLFTLILQYYRMKLVSYFIWGIWRGVSFFGLQITFFDIKKLMFQELEKEASETSKPIVDVRFILVV